MAATSFTSTKTPLNIPTSFSNSNITISTPTSSTIRTPATTTVSVSPESSTVASSQMQTSPFSLSVPTSSLSVTTYSTPEELKRCPSLRRNTTIVSGSNSGQPSSNETRINTVKFRVSTYDRAAGTVVRVECDSKTPSPSVVYLKCKDTGQWNETLPECLAMRLDISSFMVYFSMASLVSCLTVFVLLILLCNILMSTKKKYSSAESSGDSEKNIYADPYSMSDALARSTSKTRSSKSDTPYDKPIVYSTILNSTYYGDACNRWGKQEQIVLEEVYNSPWEQQRGLTAQLEATEFGWNQISLRNLGQTGFSKLPRAQLSSDNASVYSSDTIGQISGAHLHTLRLSQSKADSSRSPFVPTRHRPIIAVDPRREILVDRTGTSISKDYDCQSTMVDIDIESTDGITNL